MYSTHINIPVRTYERTKVWSRIGVVGWRGWIHIFKLGLLLCTNTHRLQCMLRASIRLPKFICTHRRLKALSRYFRHPQFAASLQWVSRPKCNQLFCLACEIIKVQLARIQITHKYICGSEYVAAQYVRFAACRPKARSALFECANCNRILVLFGVVNQFPQLLCMYGVKNDTIICCSFG